MKVTRQEMHCSGPAALLMAPAVCTAVIAIEIRGEHDVRSTSLVLEQVAWDAGWNIKTQQCTLCRPRGERPERPTR